MRGSVNRSCLGNHRSLGTGPMVFHSAWSALIAWALKVSHGNKSKAAELLHVPYTPTGA